MMDNNDELKALWGSSPAVPAPDIKSLIAQATTIKRKLRYRMIWGNLLLVATAIFISWVWVHYQPEMITTKVGIVLVVAAIAMQVAVSSALLQSLFRGEPDSSAADYLAQLLRLRQRQEFLQKTLLVFYYIMLSAGLVLYMIEYTRMMPLAGAIAAYAITIGWIAFSWFYIRPRTARKQLAPLNEVIQQLQKVNKQLAD